MHRGVAVVTGASSGIGAATAMALAAEGFEVILGARRIDRLAEVASAIGSAAQYRELDVTKLDSVIAFCDDIADCRLLVNNAGGALGLAPIAEADEQQWQTMYETNVIGLLRMTKALLPKLIASTNGHIINIGSIASFEPYPGGGGYNAAKFGVRAVSHVLRMELNGQPVRVSEIDPGLTKTDFSLTRFDGDEARAEAVYEGVTPLVANDIAQCIAFVATRPSHVDIDEMVIRPRDQARISLMHRTAPQS